jgi:general stress protein 26
MQPRQPVSKKGGVAVSSSSDVSIDYATRIRDVQQFLESKRAVVLATCADERVTARTVSLVTDGLEMYFMSWEHNLKCVQIRTNSRVALCRDNVQIEGKAEILGSPLDEKNRRAADLLRSKYPEDYAVYSGQPGMTVVKVVPQLIRLFRKEGDRFLLEQLDVARQTAAVGPLDR